MIYLDHAATTPVFPGALEAAWPWLTTEFGNPSSTHELGLRAERALSDARRTVADWLDVRPHDIVFTSGGTEGDNTAIIGLALAHPRGRHLVSARTEHEAVLESLDFLERVHNFEVTWLPVSATGNISMTDVRAALRQDTTLVTLMLANNEIGTIHPIRDIADLAHEVGALVHTDAVQAAAWLDVRPAQLGVDALTLSGHKLGAPKGSGAMYIRGGLSLEPLLHGGGQEDGRRSGTENVAWAIALATAISRALPHGDELSVAAERVARMRDEFVRTVCAGVPEAIPTGDADHRLPSIASFVFHDFGGEPLLLALEERGVLISSGAACAAGKDEPSHVITACGYDDAVAQTSVRVSLSHQTTREEMAVAAREFIDAASDLRALRPNPTA